MRILVTNDDGIDSIGLHILARAMRPLGEVVVVAPDREFSGASASVGPIHDLRPEVRRCHIDGVDTAWSLSGPPALCVMFARLGAFGQPFDLVVAGINPGANVGRAVYHSGTVGAALTARNAGITGVAVSQAVLGLGVEGQGWDEMLVGLQWDTAADVAARFVRAIIEHPPAEAVVANINVPNVASDELKGWRIADVGGEPPNRVSSAVLEPRVGHPDSFTVRMDWGPSGQLAADSDGHLLREGYVTLSYLSRLTSVDPDLAAAEAVFNCG